MAATSQQLYKAGPANPVPINLAKFRWGVGILVYVPLTTACTYNVEVTGDEPQKGFNYWNLHDILQGLTASANSNLAFPCSGIRINILSISGPGPVVFSVVEVDG